MGQTLDIIWVAVRALLQTFMVVGVGALITHAGLFGKETTSNLGRVRHLFPSFCGFLKPLPSYPPQTNFIRCHSCLYFGFYYRKISYYIFIPALSFYKICAGVSWAQIKSAWPLVMYPSIFAGTGFCLGAVVVRLLRIESKQLRHSITLTLMFGNYGSLPFSLLQTVTKDVYPFSADALAMQRSFAYSSIFMSTASLWLWSFGPWYIRRSRAVPLESTEVGQVEELPESQNASKRREEETDDGIELESMDSELKEGEEDRSGSKNANTYANGSHTPSAIAPLDDFQPRLPFRQRVAARASAIFQTVWNSGIWSLITPSTIACILAVIIVAIAPLHDLFYEHVPEIVLPGTSSAPSTMTPAPSLTPTFNMTQIAPDGQVFCVAPPTTNAAVSEKPPIQFVADTINSLANVCVPVALLLLGSNLFNTVKGQLMRAKLQKEQLQLQTELESARRQEISENGSHQDDASTSSALIDTNAEPAPVKSILPLSKRVLFGAVAARLIVLPILCFLITWVISKLHILPADPLVTIVLSIEGCMPSAINLIILAQLQDDQTVVEQLSTILLGQYLFCTFTIFTTIAAAIKVFL